jgi:hypothetical protein
MGQDELDLIETLAAAPVLDGPDPAVAGVAQAMDENDSRRVPRGGREQQGRRAYYGRHAYGT